MALDDGQTVKRDQSSYSSQLKAVPVVRPHAANRFNGSQNPVEAGLRGGSVVETNHLRPIGAMVHSSEHSASHRQA